MALGAALATGKPQAYAVVPGPGLLNSSAALLTAYSMNAPVLALVGQIPDADIGRNLGEWAGVPVLSDPKFSIPKGSGATRTGMRKEAFPGENPETLPAPEAHGEGLIQLALPSCTMNGQWVAGDAAIAKDQKPTH